MLYKYEARNASGAVLSFTLDDVTQGFVVQDVDGLDPVKATLNASTFAGLDGQQFQSAQRELRNIVLTLGLDPDPSSDDTPRSLRNLLYSFFMPKSEVSLRFYMEEGLTVDIVGRVESMEAPLFTQAPAAVISIICFETDFYDATPVVVTGNTVSTSTNSTIAYEGTVETGLVLKLNVNRSLSEFTIYQTAPDGSLRSLDVQSDLVSGDVVTISTVTGNKSATLTRGGITTSILYAVSPQSVWMHLQPGTNQYRVYAVGAAIPYEIDYTTRYGGL